MGFFSRKPPALPDQVPSGPWSMFQGTNDGQLLLARVHTGVESIQGHAAYPWRVDIATRVRDVAANGMPSPDENAALQELEERLQSALEGEREAVFVIAITTAGIK